MALPGSGHDAPSTLEEAVKEREEGLEPVNVKAPFNPESPDKTFNELTAKAFPGNPQEQARYKAKIIASLEKHVKGSIDELWSFLKKRYCRLTAIIEGILRFYSDEAGKQEIGLEQFLKPVEFGAESNLDKAYTERRETTIKSTRTQLASLLDEIREQNPLA